MDQQSEQLLQAGINIFTLKKGDYFTEEQVDLAYRLMNPDVEQKIERFERGELKTDPMIYAPTNVKTFVERQCAEMGRPVVCRNPGRGLQVLTDAEAVNYLNSQANAGLRKHERKTNQLMTAVDSSQLNDHQRRQLENNQRKHAFVLAAHKGARSQSLKMQRRGLQLPNFTDDLGDKTQK